MSYSHDKMEVGPDSRSSISYQTEYTLPPIRFLQQHQLDRPAMRLNVPNDACESLNCVPRHESPSAHQPVEMSRAPPMLREDSNASSGSSSRYINLPCRSMTIQSPMSILTPETSPAQSSPTSAFAAEHRRNSCDVIEAAESLRKLGGNNSEIQGQYPEWNKPSYTSPIRGSIDQTEFQDRYRDSTFQERPVIRDSAQSSLPFGSFHSSIDVIADVTRSAAPGWGIGSDFTRRSATYWPSSAAPASEQLLPARRSSSSSRGEESSSQRQIALTGSLWPNSPVNYNLPASPTANIGLNQQTPISPTDNHPSHFLGSRALPPPPAFQSGLNIGTSNTSYDLPPPPLPRNNYEEYSKTSYSHRQSCHQYSHDATTSTQASASGRNLQLRQRSPNSADTLPDPTSFEERPLRSVEALEAERTIGVPASNRAARFITSQRDSVDTTETESQDDREPGAQSSSEDTSAPRGGRATNRRMPRRTARGAAATAEATPARPRRQNRRTATRPQNRETAPSDWRCEYLHGECMFGNAPRKCVSHFFGRNKTCTKRLPANAWIYYCRRHYQRSRYRGQTHERGDIYWEDQATLIAKQMERFEERVGAITWTIKLQKSLQEDLDRDNARRIQGGALSEEDVGSPERLQEIVEARQLWPYCGTDKTSADVRNVLALMTGACSNGRLDSLPALEFLPMTFAGLQ